MLDETALKFAENRGTFVFRCCRKDIIIWYRKRLMEISLLGNEPCLNLLIKNNFVSLIIKYLKIILIINIFFTHKSVKPIISG